MAHKTASGRSSQAWKDFERNQAELYRSVGFAKAARISRGDDLGESDVDIEVPEVPALKLDTKYKQGGWSVMTLFETVEKKYTRKGTDDFLVMPIKSGGKPGSVSVLRSEVLAELIAHKFLGENRGQRFSCPQCRSQKLLTNALPMGLTTCGCANCGLTFQVASKDLPPETPVAA